MRTLTSMLGSLSAPGSNHTSLDHLCISESFLSSLPLPEGATEVNSSCTKDEGDEMVGKPPISHSEKWFLQGRSGAQKHCTNKERSLQHRRRHGLSSVPNTMKDWEQNPGKNNPTMECRPMRVDSAMKVPDIISKHTFSQLVLN